MARLKEPVKLMAHESPCLALGVLDEAGKDVHVEFSAGYATVDDPYILEQLLDSPVRGDGRPAHFRILALDDQCRDMIDAARVGVHRKSFVPQDRSLEGLSLADAILTVLKAHPAMSYSRAQIEESVRAGGYSSKSDNFSVIVTASLRELGRKDLVSYNGTEWKLKGQ
jgi:hypothetical protein